MVGRFSVPAAADSPSAFQNSKVFTISGSNRATRREVERCVPGTCGELGALSRHIAFDVGEDGFEFVRCGSKRE